MRLNFWSSCHHLANAGFRGFFSPWSFIQNCHRTWDFVFSQTLCQLNYILNHKEWLIICFVTLFKLKLQIFYLNNEIISQPIRLLAGLFRPPITYKIHPCVLISFCPLDTEFPELREPQLGNDPHHISLQACL